MSEPLCSTCTNAAFDQGGVYCKLFNETILNERVAADCGEYDEEPEPPVTVSYVGRGEARCGTITRLPVPQRWEPPERDRSLSVQLDIDFYGHEEHAEKIVRDLEREMALRFGDRVQVKRL